MLRCVYIGKLSSKKAGMKAEEYRKYISISYYFQDQNIQCIKQMQCTKMHMYVLILQISP